LIKLIHTGPFGVNTLIVSIGGSDVFIVDPASCDFSGDRTAVTVYLAASGLVPKAVVLTHGHFDHVAGISFLKECYPGLPVLIHRDDASLIGKNSGVLQSRGLSYMGFEEFLPFVSNLPEPTAFLEDNALLSDYFSCSGSGDWRIIHTPGHTKGSCCLFNSKENILISGDCVFYRSFGRTDLPGGSDFEMRQSLLRLRNEIPANALVYPGHDRTGFCFSENF